MDSQNGVCEVGIHVDYLGKPVGRDSRDGSSRRNLPDLISKYMRHRCRIAQPRLLPCPKLHSFVQVHHSSCALISSDSGSVSVESG